MIRPVHLKPGDTIALVSPAKAIDASRIEYAVQFFESRGFNVLVGTHAAGNHHYFSGSDEERAADLQWAIDHPDVKAIICNRGGYGAVRLLDRIQWANMLREPKWLVGFSDITNFHCQLLRLDCESIHATMPLNFQENTTDALDSLLTVLKEGTIQHEWEIGSNNINGHADGILVGGNLSILYSLLGTPLCPNFENAILFIEDLSEQVYHIDRMLQAFKLAGVFNQISGLIVGGMTDMKETAVPTGFDVQQLILEQFAFRKIPIAFDVPIGHISDNRAVICGRNAAFTVHESSVFLYQ